MTSTRVKTKRKRRSRRLKLQKLRRQIAETNDLSKRRQLIDKIKRTSRNAPTPDGL
ncbi:MAG: hypothetical protein JXA89_09695 [Anaerolineae bacterium]|nr:hypothetical protein [Anaerolineae bacterium]